MSPTTEESLSVFFPEHLDRSLECGLKEAPGVRAGRREAVSHSTATCGKHHGPLAWYGVIFSGHGNSVLDSHRSPIFFPVA